jgi:alcohol dehydrogenase
MMLLGANYAGRAIEESMLGAAHATANPLTARHGITHGIAVALMLPRVIEFNAPVCEQWYTELLEGAPEESAARTLARKIRALARLAGLPVTLTECGVDPADIPALAEMAAKQWTGTFNPRPLSVGDFEQLYRDALA